MKYSRNTAFRQTIWQWMYGQWLRYMWFSIYWVCYHYGKEQERCVEAEIYGLDKWLLVIEISSFPFLHTIIQYSIQYEINS